MANEWGDSPVLTAPAANEWGDAPASPYAAVIAEQQDFQRRAAANTPEEIARRAFVDEEAITRSTPIPTGMGFDLPLSVAQPLMENFPRVAAPLGAALSLTGVGALPGAGLMLAAGGLGEIGSQALEREFGSREDFSIPQIATNALLSSAPPLRLAGIASPVVRGGLRAAEGAGYGALAPIVEAGFRGELADPEAIRQGAVFGGTLGVPFGAAELAVGRKAAVQRISAAPTPEAKLQVLDQELKLAGDTLTPTEQRGALDLKQKLEGQVDAQKAAEQQAKEAERVQKEQQKLVTDAQKAAQEALQPPEIPKSAQILAESSQPKSIANVATEIGTQTSPYALQGKLNELAAPKPEGQVAAEAPVAPEQVAPATQQGIVDAPAVVKPPTLADDIAAYKENAKKFSALIKAGAVDTPEFQRVFALNEQIKNRHGGMPPGEVAAERAQFSPNKAAIITPSGKTFTGNNHFEAYVSAADAGEYTKLGVKNGDTLRELKADGNKDEYDIINHMAESTIDEGFVDNSGKFISRDNLTKKMSGGTEREYDSADLPATPLPATKESRLNDAGAELPPLSSLTRAQKRAELDAAGITSYKGKPLDDINPAELSNAVGKLRRGESLEVATDIIERLTDRKRLPKRPRGELPSAGPDLIFDAAHDAAIDVAILAIRAGRTLAEVVQMAIARFRQLHPNATEEQLTRLSQDIEVAHGYGDPTPGRTEAEQIVGDAGALESAPGRSPEATVAASRMRQTRGAITVPGGKKQTETPEFKKWFGGSKVVDDSGAPVVVYKAMYPKNWEHPDLADITSINRPSEFPAFNKGEKGVKIAGFFGDIPTANRFAESAGTGQAIFPAYLSLKKPFIIEADGRFAGDVQFGESGKPFREAIRSGKYDGVIIRNTKDEGTIYVALEPTQIKSAIGNRGTFDPSNPDIRASIPPSVLAPIGGAASGGAIGYTQTERLPGESDEAYNARRIENAVIGAAAGGGAGASVGLLARGARVARERAKATRSGKVDLPTPGEGQGIRQTAAKVIENRSYPEQLREVLADDPQILYDKISQKRIQELTQGATDGELVEMLASADPNIRIGALIQQANRAAVTPGMEAEGARLYREVAKNFTSPAQFLGMAKLVESPQAMVDAVIETLRQSVPKGTKIPTLSLQAQNKLFDLATNNIRAEQRFNASERAARDNFNPTTKAEYLSARNAVGATRKALADYTKDILPERFGEIVSKIIKGNLLAPLSFAKNAFGNAAWQSLLRGSETIATGLDAVYSQITKRPRAMALGNPVPGKEELEAFGQGVKIAGKELLTGPGTESYIKSEVQRGFHPVRAMLQVFSGVPAAERIMERRGIASLPENSPATARVKKFIEGTLGITPEASFRLLNMGDKPVRMAVEQRILSEQANLRGLRGVEREKFMLLPDERTQALVEQEGLGGVLAQENKLAVKVGKIFDSGLVDLAESMRMGRSPIMEDLNKIAGTLAIPYRQFPANFAITAANFALPPVAFARAALQSRDGNRREALRNIGEGVIGAMFLAGAGYLWDKGLISEPADPRDKKRRSAQYETMGAQRINLSGLERLRNGQDPTYRRGDDTRDWSTIGPAAASFYVFTKAKSKDLNKAARTGDPAEDRSDLEVLLNVTDAAGFAFDQSFLSGTSAFIDALQDWDNYGDRFIQNTFRAITSTVAPNSLEAFARTGYKFIPEQKGDSLRETLENVWDYKTMQLSQDERSNYKRDFWGNPVTRTPQGQNPYIAQFLDVTKAETKQPDAFKSALLQLYQQTRSTDVYPALVTNRLTVSGDGGSTTVELTPTDYDDLQDFVGQAREDYAKRIVSDPRFNADKILPEQKILALNAAYTEGAKLGKAMLIKSAGFQQRYPELFGQPTPKGQESRVISRDTKARGVLRSRQQNEWGDTPAAP